MESIFAAFLASDRPKGTIIVHGVVQEEESGDESELETIGHMNLSV